MATKRSTLRSSLQRKTDGKLTDSGDQDTLLDLADRIVQSDWKEFDKSLLRYAKGSAATDANGILALDIEVVEIERIQSTEDVKYHPIGVDEQFNRTGYFFRGVDTNKQKRQVQIMESGSAKASTTIEWFGLQLNLMGTAATAEPVIPEEFREMIAVKAAQIYFEEQGPALLSTARDWESKYGALPDPPRTPHGTGWLGRAWRSYRALDDEPIFADSYDPDAGGEPVIQHVIT